MIVDIHAHTTEKRLWGLHVESATIGDLENVSGEQNIDKIVLMATYFPFKKSGLTNRELLQKISGKENFLMFASLDAMNNLDDGIKELEEFLAHDQVVGIKLYPGYQNFRLADEKIFPIYELAKDKNIPIAVHSGELHHCRPIDPRTGKREYKCKEKCYIEELGHLSMPREIIVPAKKFKEVKFIMCHLGNPYFQELRDVMAQCSNVYTDISGQFLSGSYEDTAEYREFVVGEIIKFLELGNGSDRLLFGSDFPIQSHKDSIDLIKSLCLEKETEEKIFFRNALKILNIKEESL